MSDFKEAARKIIETQTEELIRKEFRKLRKELITKISWIARDLIRGKRFNSRLLKAIEKYMFEMFEENGFYDYIDKKTTKKIHKRVANLIANGGFGK